MTSSSACASAAMTSGRWTCTSTGSSGSSATPRTVAASPGAPRSAAARTVCSPCARSRWSPAGPRSRRQARADLCRVVRMHKPPPRAGALRAEGSAIEDAAGEMVCLDGASARIVRDEEDPARPRGQCITIVASRDAAIHPLSLLHGRAQQQQWRAEREQDRLQQHEASAAGGECPRGTGEHAVHRDEGHDQQGAGGAGEPEAQRCAQDERKRRDEHERVRNGERARAERHEARQRDTNSEQDGLDDARLRQHRTG